MPEWTHTSLSQDLNKLFLSLFIFSTVKWVNYIQRIYVVKANLFAHSYHFPAIRVKPIII